MTTKKDLINFLKTSVTNLANVSLKDNDFKNSLLNSLRKLQDIPTNTVKNIDFFNDINQDGIDDNVDDDTSYSSIHKDITSLNKNVMEAIRHHINFDEVSGDGASYLFKNLGSDYWNESITNAINKLNDLNNSLTNGDIEGTNLSVDEIKKANAGYTFNNHDSDLLAAAIKWVMPNRNSFDSTYWRVRNELTETSAAYGDAVISVLENINNLQFTHTQEQPDNWDEISKWIRLIMPKNSRRVEIEDLNRNFWVIAQVVSAICGFLFDDDNSIDGIIKLILDEMFQLWENILWLWIAMLANMAQNNSVHVEIVPLYEGGQETSKGIKSYQRHFDNFVGAENHTAAVQRTLDNLANKYPNKHLVVLIQERKNNYMYNYYKTESYPSIYFKARFWDTWSECPLNAFIDTQNDIIGKKMNNGENIDNGDFGRIIKFNISEFLPKAKDESRTPLANTGINLKPYIGQIQDWNNGACKFSYPADTPMSGGFRAFSALRIIPSIDVSFVEPTVNGGNYFLLEKLSFTIYDISIQGQYTNHFSKGKGFQNYLYKLSFQPDLGNVDENTGIPKEKIIVHGKTITLKEDTSMADRPNYPKKDSLGNPTTTRLKYNSGLLNYYLRNQRSFYLGELVTELRPTHEKPPFGEWIHLYPLLSVDKEEDGIYKDTKGLPDSGFSISSLNEQNIKIDNVRALSAKARPKAYSKATPSKIDNKFIEELGINYLGGLSENAPLSVAIFTRGYELPNSQSNLQGYDRYYESSNIYKEQSKIEMPLKGNQILFLAMNGNRVGSVTCVKTDADSNPSLFSNIGTMTKPKWSMNLGNFVCWSDMPRKSTGKAEFVFPQRVEYFGKWFSYQRKTDSNWLVRYTGLSVSYVDKDQINWSELNSFYSSSENDYNEEHPLIAYVNGKYAVLTQKIIIYGTPSPNGVAMRYRMIQKNYHPQTANYGTTESPKILITGFDVKTLYGYNGNYLITYLEQDQDSEPECQENEKPTVVNDNLAYLKAINENNKKIFGTYVESGTGATRNWSFGSNLYTNATDYLSQYPYHETQKVQSDELLEAFQNTDDLLPSGVQYFDSYNPGEWVNPNPEN